MLPLRWLSPEVITSGLFTSKSDVWAFGVLLWEIITLGEQPYSNRQNPEVLNLISNGICLERPVECPNELYEQMKACWTVDTEKRPRFLDIQPRMESIRGLPHFQAFMAMNSFYESIFSQESHSLLAFGMASIIPRIQALPHAILAQQMEATLPLDSTSKRAVLAKKGQ